jgi:hypothetical protein
MRLKGESDDEHMLEDVRSYLITLQITRELDMGDCTCYGPVLDRNGRHSTRLFMDTYRDTDPSLA